MYERRPQAGAHVLVVQREPVPVRGEPAPAGHDRLLVERVHPDDDQRQPHEQEHEQAQTGGEGVAADVHCASVAGWARRSTKSSTISTTMMLTASAEPNG